ncbi:hypothetical protein HDU97_000392 [Phlyctochytrium planicorne]|nr:hypothetical protein HDU97_000392 [Phlyctochytrium planicorne]
MSSHVHALYDPITGQILTVILFPSFPLGIIAIILSVYVRRRRAQLKSHSGGPIFHLNQFEVFLALYTLACLLGTIALSLSAFVNISSLLFYSMVGPRNVIIYISFLIYTDMVLAANAYKDGLEHLRKIYLRLLILPISIVFGLFMYQGLLSDRVHYGYGSTPPNDPDTTKTFNLVTVLNTMLWLSCFLALDVLVFISWRNFAKYLREVVEPELAKERAAAEAVRIANGLTASSTSSPSMMGLTFSSSHNSGSQNQGPRTKTRELASSLRSGISTMKVAFFSILIFLVYSVFFAAVLLFFGETNPIYFITLLVNWWFPTAFGLVLFSIILRQRWRQLTDMTEVVEVVMEQGSAGVSSGNHIPYPANSGRPYEASKDRSFDQTREKSYEMSPRNRSLDQPQSNYFVERKPEYPPSSYINTDPKPRRY